MSKLSKPWLRDECPPGMPVAVGDRFWFEDHQTDRMLGVKGITSVLTVRELIKEDGVPVAVCGTSQMDVFQSVHVPIEKLASETTYKRMLKEESTPGNRSE